MDFFYGEQYYNEYGAEKNGYDSFGIRQSFERIAEAIHSTINPSSALDVGCAFGFLVAGLRELGVDAWGLDFSEYAINQVADEITPYCKVGSVLNPLPEGMPKHYDLVTCIEVLEHLEENASIAAVERLCELADVILISTTPDDLLDPSHRNVQQQEYWARHFAKNGFFRILSAKPDYVSPHAMLFAKGMPSTFELVEDYERSLRIAMTELIELREQYRTQNIEYAKIKNVDLVEAKRALGQVNIESEQFEAAARKAEENVSFFQERYLNTINQLQTAKMLQSQAEQRSEQWHAQNDQLFAQLTYTQNAIEEIRRSTSWRITKPLRWLGRKLKGNPSIDTGTVTPPIYTTETTSVPSDYESLSGIETMLLRRFRFTQAIPHYHHENEQRWVNIVTDSLQAESMAGGVATALVIATLFANTNKLPLRVITRTHPANPESYFSIIELHGIDRPIQVDFYCDSDRSLTGEKNFKLAIKEDDIFIATSWWSASAIDKTINGRCFFYIIQEVETYFYPRSDEHLLCSQIMKKQNIRFLVNSQLLFDYFRENEPIIYQNGFCFEPAFACYHKGQLKKKDNCTLFFYARPNHPRNLLAFGVNIINRCFETGILDPNEWRIYCLGSDEVDLRFSNGVKAINLGKLGWSEYATFLQNVDLALSLMYTPHPSYPPFDVAASGGVVVTNKYLNKTELPQSRNILLSALDENEFLEVMEKGVNLAKNLDQRRLNLERSTILTDWHLSLDGLIAKMGEYL